MRGRQVGHGRKRPPRLSKAAVAAVASVMPVSGRGVGVGVGGYGGTLLSHELTVGTDYELVITNLGGLSRYLIGDVVRPVGHMPWPRRHPYM